MHYLLEIRKKLNLSLQDLAEYLMVGRELIHKAENGQRRLHGYELQFATKLKMVLDEKDQKKIDLPYSNKKEIDEMRIELDNKLIELEFQLGNREQDLKKMEKQYKVVCESLNYYNFLQTKINFFSQTKRKWIQQNREYQEKIQAENGLMMQHKLKFRIKSLKDEIQYYNNVLRVSGK
jgi:predicted transcriptional regulator